MSFLRDLLFARGGVSEARALRRLTKIWLATGAVPVAHIVPDFDDTAAVVSPVLRPVTDRARRAQASRRVPPW